MHIERLANAPSPESVALALRDRPGLVWLDGQGASEAARFSFVGSDPVEVRTRAWGASEPLSIFDELSLPKDAGTTAPFPARIPSWIGVLAYDAAWSGGLRAALHHPRSSSLPMAWFGRYDALFAFDARTGDVFCVGDDPSACRRLHERVASGHGDEPKARAGELSVERPELHLHAIERALEHIARGDIYQVNLARRFTASFDGSSLALFRAMRRQSPVPYGFFLSAETHSVLSATMELFLRWDRARGEIATRPIKGTIARPPGSDPDRLEADLRSDAKEHAEHTMIVDLMRNDLGRIAETGSVAVAEAFVVEPYAGLSHLVSTVRCRAVPHLRLRALLEATFPPGSVTGTPKMRAVEIIEALERSARGIYTGTVGWVDREGGVELAVAIRTAVVHEGWVNYFAGGGIVEASDPLRELEETDLKAEVFRSALARLDR